MKKIITLFERDFENNPRLVTKKVNPEAQWVIDGEGKATKKYDGTCCLVENGKLWKRYEVKKGKEEPYGFRLADFDKKTGKKQGWVEVGNGNEDKWHREAIDGNPDKIDLPNGTYELIGEKIQGNPEKVTGHFLVAHKSADEYPDVPRSFEGIKEWLKDKDMEGLVFHHTDGRMVKIKKRDFDFSK